MSHHRISRRKFFFGAALAGAIPAGGFGSIASLKRLGYKSPNEKLNIAAIGVGGKGYVDITNCKDENITAFADPDEKRAAKTFAQFPEVPRFNDFRQMFDKAGSRIDAVTVSTPDHMHGTAAMWAIERGKHVYCQKPLTHTVWEAQHLTAAARKYGVATQMGNQGYSSEGARQCCEMVWSGAIGQVTEVHAWTDRPGRYWPQGPDVVPAEAPVPPTLDWRVWLGGAADRAFSPAFAPYNWRGFADFGSGAVGDMACHTLGTPNMALRLSAPTSVECIKQEGKARYTFSKRNTIRYDFPARGSMPPVKVFWYDGLSTQPEFDFVPKGELLGDADCNGSLFIGTKGMLTAGSHGERPRLIPGEKMKDYKMPAELLTRSPGHYQDWIRACKGGDPACSNFDVAGPFVEWMLLGVIAMKYEGKLEWDAQQSRFTNNKEANQHLTPKFRKGWKFAG